MMTGPIQHFRSAIWQAWQSKVAADFSRRKGFRGGFSVDIYGSHQLLVSSHLRERDKVLLRAILCDGDGDVVGVVTPLGGVAQAFHGDQVVELRVQLTVQEVEGKEEDWEGQVEVEEEKRLKEVRSWMTMEMK